MYLLDATTEVHLATTGGQERRAQAARDHAGWRRLVVTANAAMYRIGALLVAAGQSLQATGPAQPAPATAS
jgi:hypothetical protein